MFPFTPSLLLVLLLAAPALLTPSTYNQLQVRGQRTPSDAKQDSIKVVISEDWVTQGDSSDGLQREKELELTPGTPLVLTHRIRLIPSSGSGSGSGSCGCGADFAALRERLERLEREVSTLREKCGGAEGGCCTSKESKGAGCSIKPEVDDCPNECSDQGRCAAGRCVCFPGFHGPDCSESDCPGNCNDNGRCVDGKCACDPGFTGADCARTACPDDCSDRGRCVNGRCACHGGFTGPSCSDRSCPGNCNSRGRCVDGQCVCDPGSIGPDCSKTSCPGDCNSRGRCVDGQCVCDPGSTGDDCADKSCPGNCNSRGRCVDGQCVCDVGFTGDDCADKSCPGNCNSRGRCVDGQCVCDPGSTGPDCSKTSCPGNCNSRGRCVNGKCVCDPESTGDDCADKSCPGNCNSRGRCVDGQCVCDGGFAGADCGAKGCPGNCGGKGRCVKGRCVCRRAFTGPDCSQCEEAMSGPNCDVEMLGVSQLSTRDLTETSVSLHWTPPPIQYETYYITFTSQKGSDQQIMVQVEGSRTAFTQTGLAAGQGYTVSVTGETGGRKGAESSAQFTTLTSGPANLQVVKTTSSSAVVQWEQSQGEIDRYRLTVTPNDGRGRSQEMTVPAGQDSAHIQQLEAGRLYDVVLVAEKGTSRSQPATNQVTPGKTLPKVTAAALALAPGRDAGDRHREVNPSAEVHNQQGRSEDGSEGVKVGGADDLHKDSSTSPIARTKPLLSKKLGINGTTPKVTERSALHRKPNVPVHFRLNTTRVVTGQFGPGPLKRRPAGQKKKAPIVPKKPKPGVNTIVDGTIALTRRGPSVEALSTKRSVDKNPALTSGTDSDSDRQSSSEQPTVAVGSKEQSDVGEADQENDTAPVSSQPTGTVGTQEKKCMNKVKVTHVRLPHRGKGSGYRGAGTVLGSDQGSSETDDLKPSSAKTDLDYSPDPLLKLLTDTFDSLNITTFSVHLSKPSNIPVNAETARKQILKGLRPLLPSSSWSSPSSASRSSSLAQSSSSSSLASPSLGPSPSTAAPSPPGSSSHSSGEPLSSSSSSSLASPSLGPSPSAAASSSSLTLLMSLPSSLPTPRSSSLLSLSPSTPSSSLSSAAKSGSVRSNEPDVDNRKSATEDRKLPPSRPLFRRTPAKHGFVRRLHPNFGLFPNKTRLNVRVPQHSTPRFNLVPKRESETRHTSTSELSPSPSSSASLPEFSIEVNAPIRGTSGEGDRATPTASTGVEQNPKKKPTERRRIPVRRLVPKAGYLLRRPNFGALQNRTRPILKVLPPPSRPLNPASDTRREQVSSTELPATSSSPVSKESYPARGTGPIAAENVDRVGTRMSWTSMSAEFNRTLRGRGVPSSHRPINNGDYLRWLPLYGGRFQNKTRTNLRPPQPPHKGLVRKLFPNKKLSGSSTVGGQTLQLEKDNGPENQSGGQDAPMLTQGVQIRQLGEHNTAKVIPHFQTDRHDTTVRPQIKGWDDAPIQTTKSGVETTSTPDSNSDSETHKEKLNAGKNTGATSRGGQTVKQTSSDSRHEAPRPSTRGTTAHHHAQIRHYSGGRKRKEETKTSVTAKSVDSKSPTGSAGSSSGVTREPLDHVGVTNRTSDGFTLVWDSPEEKYKHFVVTSRDVGKEEEEDSEEKGGSEEEEAKHPPTKETESENEAENRARSFPFENLPPQTEYTVTLLAKRPGLLSRLHKLVISTGPDAPTSLVFGDVTSTSLTVSWTRPPTPVSGFKVTFTHTEEGEPVSVSVAPGDSALGLATLSPGSSYEVSVVSVLGLDESDPVRGLVVTLPDPPTDLRAVNVTDTGALLLWRPALAAVDKYAIVYGAGTDSELRVSVSGNAAEQQLSGLEGSTTYHVTISSQLGGSEGSVASTSFTTTGGSDGPRDLQAHDVTPRTALLSWKPPSNRASSLRLTYGSEGQQVKEVMLDASLAEYHLTRLRPGARYAVQLRADGGAPVATDFTTGTLRFPFPSDCSQELLNGIGTSGEVEVFPRGKLGTPVLVSCDMETDGGGWTVFQRRKDGSVDFFRGWKDYTKGFGSPSGEFWLGLESLYNLTSMTRMSLRVDLRDKDEAVFAKYSKFELVKRNYKLIVGGYSGTAGDSLSYHSERIFSTRDRDLSPFITRCAMSYRGGWWYKNCHEANLNGAYGTHFNHQGVIWTAWKGQQFSIPFTEMKMRPAAFSPPTRG